MAFIGNQPAESFTSFATQEFSTSATTSYTLDHAVTNENEIALFVNNVRQQPGSGKAYTASGTTLTLSEATASTDTMYCVFLGRALQTVTPATNSITAAMVGNDLISGKDALASTPDDTDELLISDAGTLKRIDYSLIKSAPGLTKLSSTTLTSTASSIDFTSSIITSTYDAYFFTILASPQTDNTSLRLRLSVSDSFIDSSSTYGYAYLSDSGSGTSSNGSDKMILITPTDNSLANAVQGSLYLFNPTNSSIKSVAMWNLHRNDGDPAIGIGGGQRLNAEANDGIRFYFSSGDISVGSTITCYGVTK